MKSGLTVAYWALLLAALLPIFCAGLAKWGMFSRSRKDGGYDNHNPRAWLARQTDWRARANAAQANTFEALPFFFAAVIIAHQAGAYQMRLDVMAFLWVFLRVLYVLLYVADQATARSLVWLLALALNIGILFA
ncbi:MAPEG family protein [uncultured Hydrogenophaga sp.]|uniref:MAPEG family protein n=1 Tax=uncultured Hydrogenophaga sp. TaxID=199683 RepID=UPI00265FF315|nr:MAPEG family protein [uncultured Hydrogenophaga sp.]